VFFKVAMLEETSKWGECWKTLLRLCRLLSVCRL